MPFRKLCNLRRKNWPSPKKKEVLAIESKRSFDTNAAQFKSELVNIQRTYEDQLIELCGTIDVNGVIYPAIQQYASLSEATKNILNPCGITGGALFEAKQQVDSQRLNLKQFSISAKNTLAAIQDEEKRVQDTCNSNFKLADAVKRETQNKIDLEQTITETEQIVATAERVSNVVTALAEAQKCTTFIGTTVGGDCLSAIPAVAVIGAAGAAAEVVIGLANNNILSKQKELAETEQQIQDLQLRAECNKESSDTGIGTVYIESQVKLKELVRQIPLDALSTMNAFVELKTVLQNRLSMERKVKRVLMEWEEQRQLQLNVQSASNDPNVRIYKNDAIINAETTFNDAIREAYRATIVYEYYTSQSYGNKNNLFLIKLVSHGDKHLESYLSNLEQAFRDFEEKNGKPDLRVAIVSLKNDILRIPYLKANGGVNTEGDRTRLFRAELQNPDHLNSAGYLSFNFRISVDEGSKDVSPVTFNHKILFIQADLVGGLDNSDDLGRIYLRQKGVSVVRPGVGETAVLYTLDTRTAVINTLFNGAMSQVFTADIYSNYRLRDRPLGNSKWQLLFNQVTETVNQDINLQLLDDIKLYIYYTDFTDFN